MAKTKKVPAAKAATAPPRADLNGWVLCPGDSVLIVSPGEEYHGLFGKVDAFPTTLELSCYVQIDDRPSTSGRVLLPNAQLRWMGPDEAQLDLYRPTRPGQQVRVVLENEALATPELKALEGKLGTVTELSPTTNDLSMVTVKFEDPDLAPWPTAINSFDLLVVPIPVVQYVPEPVPVEQEPDLPFIEPKAAPKQKVGFEHFNDMLHTAQAGLRVLPLASIVVTRNTRKVFDEAALAELAESIKAHGVLQPIVVRPAAETGQYELVAGERRYRAALAAGLTEIPATVRTLTDREFLEVQLLENLQRVDVRPADEAQAFAELLKNGYSAEEIGLKVGKGEKFVLQRAKLVDLSPYWLDLLIQERLPLVAAQELARLPLLAQGVVQQRIEANMTWEMRNGKVIQASSVTGYINQEILRQLDSAPWDKADATLWPPAGPCTTCPKRSGACRGLFDDLTTAGKSDTCLDIACFTKKKEVFLAKRTQEATAQGTPLLSSSYDNPPRGAVGSKHYSDAKKGDKGAVQALVVDGYNAGSLKWVKLSTTAADLPQSRKEEREVAMRKNRLGRMKNELWAGKLRDTFVEELNNPRAPHGDAAAQALLDHWLRRSFTFGRTRTPNDLLAYLVQHYGWQEPVGDDLDSSWVSKGQNGHDKYINRQLAPMSVLDKVGLFFDLKIRDGLEQNEVCAGQFNLVQALPKSYQPGFDITAEAEQAVEARYYTRKGKKQEVPA